MLVTTKLNTNNEHRETLALEARMTFWDSREIQVAMKKNEKCFLRVTNNIFVIEHASRLPFPFSSSKQHNKPKCFRKKSAPPSRGKETAKGINGKSVKSSAESNSIKN